MGNLFVARTASIITTCVLQGKNVVRYLEKLVARYFAGKPPPLFSKI
jgi:hypothetical protein